MVQEDRGRGPDVTALHHDVGLVRTRTDIQLTTAPRLDPLLAMSLYNPLNLANEEIVVRILYFISFFYNYTTK